MLALTRRWVLSAVGGAVGRSWRDDSVSLRVIVVCNGSSTAAASFSNSAPAPALDLQRVKAISFDLTGTVFSFRQPIGDTYHDAAGAIGLKDVPSKAALNRGFKLAFKEMLQTSPCYGQNQMLTERQWWRRVVEKSINLAHAETLHSLGPLASAAISGAAPDSGPAPPPVLSYSDWEMDRLLRTINQHYSSVEAFTVAPDAHYVLSQLARSIIASTGNKRFVLGVLTNSPIRTVESTLPLLRLHQYFQWFVSTEDIGMNKPAPQAFQRALEEIQRLQPNIQPAEVLHIGDDVQADYLGARAFGIQALCIGQDGDPRVPNEHRIPTLSSLLSMLGIHAEERSSN